jgi:predicted transcriptional regulator
LAIARGEYQPRSDEPKIWFESVRSMAQVLSNENQLLLKTILDREGVDCPAHPGPYQFRAKDP